MGPTLDFWMVVLTQHETQVLAFVSGVVDLYLEVQARSRAMLGAPSRGATRIDGTLKATASYDAFVEVG